MLEVKNKKTRRRSLFLITMLISCTTLVAFITGCDQDKPVISPINQSVVNLKNRVEKKFSDSLKAKNIKPGTKNVTPVTKVKAQSNIMGKIKKATVKPIYNSKIAHLRDPFVPFIKFTEEIGKGRKKNKPLLPLQRYTLTQLKLIAIIDAGSTGKWAMVQDASGKGYTVKKGMLVGSEGGFVKDIVRGQVIVQKNIVDLLGKKKKKLMILKLHPEKKGE